MSLLSCRSSSWRLWLKRMLRASCITSTDSALLGGARVVGQSLTHLLPWTLHHAEHPSRDLEKDDPTTDPHDAPHQLDPLRLTIPRRFELPTTFADVLHAEGLVAPLFRFPQERGVQSN